MKLMIAVATASLMIGTAYAQDESEELLVVLPDAAQKCVLPASPDSISESPSLDELKAAKAQIGEFQAQMMKFRDCLTEADEDKDNTAGNKQAIVNSYNYSVEMEERVAERFNEAVRAYKAAQAGGEG